MIPARIEKLMDRVDLLTITEDKNYITETELLDMARDLKIDLNKEDNREMIFLLMDIGYELQLKRLDGYLLEQLVYVKTWYK